MRKPASASADAENTRPGAVQNFAHGTTHDLATETVCLALVLALAALICRIALIW